MTCPWLTRATSRIGQAASMIPAISNRPEKSAITGSDPNRFSSTSTTAICARGRRGTRRGCFEIPIRGKLDDHTSVTHVAQTHVRKTGLAARRLAVVGGRPVGQVLGTAGVGHGADEYGRAGQQPRRPAGEGEPEHPSAGQPGERRGEACRRGTPVPFRPDDRLLGGG